MRLNPYPFVQIIVWSKNNVSFQKQLLEKHYIYKVFPQIIFFILELKWLGTENSKGGNSSLVIGSQKKSFGSVFLVKIFGAGELKS